jgi:hypothetical protein
VQAVAAADGVHGQPGLCLRKARPAGKLINCTPIHATYDVTEIKDAVAAAASGGRSGKILIVPRR